MSHHEESKLYLETLFLKKGKKIEISALKCLVQ